MNRERERELVVRLPPETSFECRGTLILLLTDSPDGMHGWNATVIFHRRQKEVERKIPRRKWFLEREQENQNH